MPVRPIFGSISTYGSRFRPMAYQAGSAILQEIGTELRAGVLVYVTGDRENLETEVDADVLRRAPRHLSALEPRWSSSALTNETATTCDTFVTHSVEVTSGRWETIA